MAETKLTNAVIPEVFSRYTVEQSIYRSRFYKSGLIEMNAGMSSLLSGGGTTFNLPFWKDVGGTSGDIPVEGSDATVNNMTSATQIFRRQLRQKVWGSNNLVNVFAGDKPMEHLADMVNDYWAQAYDQVATRTLEGVIADNVANDSSDLINDISAAAGSAAYFSDDAVIDAQAKLGENGVVGSNDSTDYVAIMVHPSTYAYMRKLDLIDFEPVSNQERPLGSYMGMTVIVDRNATLDTGDYTSYIFKKGVLQFGVSTYGYEPTEIARNELGSFGIDQLITRRVFGLHMVGTAWSDGSVAGLSPTDAELKLAANIDRVYEQENMPFVAVKHKLG